MDLAQTCVGFVVINSVYHQVGIFQLVQRPHQSIRPDGFSGWELSVLVKYAIKDPAEMDGTEKDEMLVVGTARGMAGVRLTTTNEADEFVLVCLAPGGRVVGGGDEPPCSLPGVIVGESGLLLGRECRWTLVARLTRMIVMMMMVMITIGDGCPTDVSGEQVDHCQREADPQGWFLAR